MLTSLLRLTPILVIACITPAPTIPPVDRARTPAADAPAAHADAIDAAVAQLVTALVPQAVVRASECLEHESLPLRIAVIARPTPVAEAVAARLDLALGARGEFRTTRWHEAARITRARRTEFDDNFQPESVASLGGFQGVHAIAIVAATEALGGRTEVIVHLTCVRTLVDLASAHTTLPRHVTVAATPARPTNARVVACSSQVTPGNTFDWMCCMDPSLPACAE